MGLDKARVYRELYECYLEHEEGYWKWAEMIMFFNQRIKDDYYRQTYPKLSRRTKRMNAVLADYPMASARDIKRATGSGLATIIRDCEGLKHIDNPYWKTTSYWEANWVAEHVLDNLKRDPSQIYDAIENTYEWSIKIGVRTTRIEECLPQILKDIGEGLV